MSLSHPQVARRGRAASRSFRGEAKGAARVNQTSARIVAVASYSLVVTPSVGLTGAPPGQV